MWAESPRKVPAVLALRKNPQISPPPSKRPLPPPGRAPPWPRGPLFFFRPSPPSISPPPQNPAPAPPTFSARRPPTSCFGARPGKKAHRPGFWGRESPSPPRPPFNTRFRRSPKPGVSPVPDQTRFIDPWGCVKQPRKMWLSFSPRRAPKTGGFFFPGPPFGRPRAPQGPGFFCCRPEKGFPYPAPPPSFRVLSGTRSAPFPSVRRPKPFPSFEQAGSPPPPPFPPPRGVLPRGPPQNPRVAGGNRKICVPFPPPLGRP